MRKDPLEQSSLVCHLLNFPKRQCSLENSRSTLSVPSLYSTIELFTRIEDTIVVILILYRSSQTISEHAFGQRREGVDRVIAQECRGRGGVSLRDWSARAVGRDLELEEFV